MKNKILLIEDNLELVNKHIENLSILNYEIVKVNNFEQLQSVIDNDKGEFFIALHDHIFSNDFENKALSYLMQNDIPTIVFSEKYNENISEETIAIGALDYIINNEGIDYVYISQMIERAYKNQFIETIVADGNSIAIDSQIEILSKFNIKSHKASSYDSIDALLQNNKNISLLIIDQSLNEERGTEVIFELRKKYSKENLAIIGVTEYGHSSRLAVEFLKKGANDFITKPFIREEFNLRVLQSLDTIDFIKVNKQSAMTDHLTSMYNKRAFESLAKELCQKAKLDKTTLACAMLDIDYFKQINDTHGHHIGDKVLVTVANLFREHFRKDDLVARVGGEEFVVMLNNITKEKLLEIFESFRQRVAGVIVATDTQDITLTISTGLYIANEYELNHLVERSDKLLYDAKNNGRNQVVVS